MKIDALAQEIFDDMIAHGGKVYIVGGSVRDEILGRYDQHDVDVEVYHLCSYIWKIFCDCSVRRASSL